MLALSFFLIQNPLIIYPKALVSRLTWTGYARSLDHPSNRQHFIYLFPRISLLLSVKSKVSFISTKILQFHPLILECLT